MQTSSISLTQFWDAKTGGLLRTLREPRPNEGMNITAT